MYQTVTAKINAKCVHELSIDTVNQMYNISFDSSLHMTITCATVPFAVLTLVNSPYLCSQQVDYEHNQAKSSQKYICQLLVLAETNKFTLNIMYTLTFMHVYTCFSVIVIS